MSDWIKKLYEKLLESLDDILDIVDSRTTLQLIQVFEQIPLTKAQLCDSDIMEHVQELYDQTPNDYLKYRLQNLLEMWRDVLQVNSKRHKLHRSTSNSVFEAIIMDDDKFFRTKSVPELLHRLLKSFDRHYKVTDMATVLNTIDTLEQLNISVSQLAATHLVTYIRRLRRRTTNRYLSSRLRDLLKQWRDLSLRSGNSKRKVKAK